MGENGSCVIQEKGSYHSIDIFIMKKKSPPIVDLKQNKKPENTSAPWT